MKTLSRHRTTVTSLLLLFTFMVIHVGCESLNDPEPQNTTATKPVGETGDKGFSLGPIDDFFKGGPLTGKPDPTTGVWSAKPASVAVYPGSQFVTQDNKQFLETAIELRDDMGDSVKAPGKARFELYQAGTGDTLGPHLYTWDIRIVTPAEQSTHYSRVIRAYTFRLGLDNFEVQKTPTVLVVQYELVDGTRLSARERIGDDEGS